MVIATYPSADDRMAAKKMPREVLKAIWLHFLKETLGWFATWWSTIALNRAIKKMLPSIKISIVGIVFIRTGGVLLYVYKKRGLSKSDRFKKP